MKILWLTTDRSGRVAQLFDPFRRAVSALVTVDVVDAGVWTLEQVRNGRWEPARLSPSDANGYDLIFTDAYFAFQGEPWQEFQVPRAVLIEDQHGFDVQRYINDAHSRGIDIFFSRYRDSLFHFHAYLRNRIIAWLPHAIDADVFCDHGLQRTIPALMTGSLNETIYPVRQKIYDALKDCDWFTCVPRPRERSKENRWPMGKDYARLLSQARMSFVGGSIYRYPVAKYFEIPACGTALFGDWMPELKDLGFVPFVNFIPLQDSPVEDQVRRWLANPALPRLAKAGFEMVHQRHTAPVRAEQFVNTLKRILGHELCPAAPQLQLLGCG